MYRLDWQIRLLLWYITFCIIMQNRSVITKESSAMFEKTVKPEKRPTHFLEKQSLQIK